jgi:chromosome segregation ATPase
MHEFEAQAFALKLENNSASKELNELEKDREETKLRLIPLEEAKARYYEERARLQVRNDALRSKSEELPLEKGDSNSSLSKENKATKSRLPKSRGHKLENLAGSFNESWTPERVQAYEKWELKIKRAPGLCY